MSRLGLFDVNVRMSLVFKDMLLAAVGEYDWKAYEEEHGEFDEALLDEFIDVLQEQEGLL